jgi:hypothetical protein
MKHTLCNSIPLMHQLAKLAGIEEGGFKQMILVLDIDDLPRLYTVGVIRTEQGNKVMEEPEDGWDQIIIKHDTIDVPVVIDLKTLQNDDWRTKLGLK